MAESETRQQRKIKHSSPFAWAVFLGCSWTWCIGMFLPVLMVRNWGAWGWVVFAVPNVVGAAAMGWVLGREDASRRIVADHRTTCATFSIVTVLFHVYFAGWMIAMLIGPAAAMGTFVLALGMWAVGLRRPWRDVRSAAVVFVLSLLAFATYWAMRGTPNWAELGTIPALGKRSVVWVIPVCVLGFGLCPYLDLTFHRARQATVGDGAKLAFGLGFGLFFLLMILFTLWYSPMVIELLKTGTMPVLWRWIIGGHLVIQSAFTVAAHGRAFQELAKPARSIGMTIGAIALVALVWWAMKWDVSHRVGEIIYLSFMVFYGLVFPAYVWLCMIPGRTRGRLIMTVIAILVATPMYWMGFIEGWTIWLVPGVAVVIVSRWIYSGKAASAS